MIRTVAVGALPAQVLEQGRGIDEVAGLDVGCEGEESIHQGQPESGLMAGPAVGGKAEVRLEPVAVARQASIQVRQQVCQVVRIEAVQEELRDQEVIGPGIHGGFGYSKLLEPDPEAILWALSLETPAGLGQHARAGIDDVYPGLWKAIQQACQETAVSLTEEQCVAWGLDPVESDESARLQATAIAERLEKLVDRREVVEAHVRRRKTKGAKRVRSA